MRGALSGVMASASYYRGEASRCRALAARALSPEIAKSWLALAADYDTLAEALESSPGAAHYQHAPMQQQPMQQQQSKIEPKDD